MPIVESPNFPNKSASGESAEAAFHDWTNLSLVSMGGTLHSRPVTTCSGISCKIVED